MSLMEFQLQGSRLLAVCRPAELAKPINEVAFRRMLSEEGYAGYALHTAAVAELIRRCNAEPDEFALEVGERLDGAGAALGCDPERIQLVFSNLLTNALQEIVPLAILDSPFHRRAHSPGADCEASPDSGGVLLSIGQDTPATSLEGDPGPSRPSRARRSSARRWMASANPAACTFS